MLDPGVFYIVANIIKVGEVHIKMYISTSLEISEDVSILDLHAVVTKHWADVECCLAFL